MPTASVGAPPVRDSTVVSPISFAVAVNISGVITKPQPEIAAAADSGVVPISAIAYFLADAKYVEVHFDGGEVLIEDSLVALEEEFADRFVRVHRNCLVARERIEGLGKNAVGETNVRLRGRSETLEVSRRNLPQLRRLLRLL